MKLLREKAKKNKEKVLSTAYILRRRKRTNEQRREKKYDHRTEFSSRVAKKRTAL